MDSILCGLNIASLSTGQSYPILQGKCMYELKFPGLYWNEEKTSELITMGGRTVFWRLLQEVLLRKILNLQQIFFKKYIFFHNM